MALDNQGPIHINTALRYLFGTGRLDLKRINIRHNMLS